MNEDKDTVLVIDFGSQYTHLINQKIRRLGVYSEIIYYDIVNSKPEIVEDACALILSGGPKSVLENNSPKINIEYLIRKRKPILGICYGHQLIAHILGGLVKKGKIGEYGLTRFTRSSNSSLLTGLPSEFNVWMSHGDIVKTPPKGFKIIGYSEYGYIAAMEHEHYPIITLQFHPEVKHTEFGLEILRSFVEKYTSCKKTWSPKKAIQEIYDDIRRMNIDKVLIGVSGGIDSTVTAVLLKNVIVPDNIFPVFIDTGFMRKDDKEYVKNLFSRLGFKNLVIYDASEEFISRLRGISDPERKRRLFSELYISVFERIAGSLEKKLGKIRFLAQGTLYPDRIESGVASRYADRIKSHHNVVVYGKHSFILVEPLRNLYKNEVREIAKSLNLPKDVWMRHPFPGPGLLIRIVGRVSRRKLDILRKADKIVEEEIKKYGLYENLWQAFPVLLSVKSVGIKGDKRSYEYVIVLRFVESEDAMTANYSRLDWSILDNIARRILNEVKGVNRVLYDISNKPPATIEFE